MSRLHHGDTPARARPKPPLTPPHPPPRTEHSAYRWTPTSRPGKPKNIRQ
jgi:hypothetical protein